MSTIAGQIRKNGLRKTAANHYTGTPSDEGTQIPQRKENNMRNTIGIRLSTIWLAAIIVVMICSVIVLNTDVTYAKAATPGKVSSLKITSKTDSSISIKWGAAKKAKKYQVAYKRSSDKDFSVVTLSSSRSYTIADLKPGTNYSIKVRGKKGSKTGKWSAVKKAKTTGSSLNYSNPVNETKLTVKANKNDITIQVQPLGSGTGDLIRVKANEYVSGDSIRGLVSKSTAGSKVQSIDLSQGKTITIPRYADNGYDRLYDKYYIVSGGNIVRGPVYATQISSLRGAVEKPVNTKKGVIDESDSASSAIASDLGCGWTAMNIDLTGLVMANETASGKPIDNSGKSGDTIKVNGKTYYMNPASVAAMDADLKDYEKRGINVVAVVISFVSTEGQYNYPRALKYIDDARWTNGFNTSNELGRDYFIAAMEFLANRYSQKGNGLICDYVISNEVDMAYDWNEIIPNRSKSGHALPARGSKDLRSGEIETTAPLDVYMEEYSRAMRLANLAVKKYAPDMRVGVSLSKHWAMSYREWQGLQPAKNKRYDSYRPKEMLDWLNYRSKQCGDYDWTITPHNYPLTSGNAALYETKNKLINGSVDGTKLITQNNLEVFQLYLNRSGNLYNGSTRLAYYTENGCSSGTKAGTPSKKAQKEQAAAIAQYYYRAACLPSTKAIIYYKIKDRVAEGSTSLKMGLIDTKGKKKLSYELWKNIDTSKSFTTANKYLGNISYMKGGKLYSKSKKRVKSYYDLMPMVKSSFKWKSNWNKSKIITR